MTDLFAAIDAHLDGLFAPDDPALTASLEHARAAGLPEIAISPGQGKILYLLAKLTGARRILEIGTLGGYSGAWLARALPPGGQLVTLELEPLHAEVARATFARCGVAEECEVRVGPAADSLAALAAAGTDPFDVVFIDADKPGYPAYWEGALRLSRPGTLILADNVVRGGRILAPPADDANAAAMRDFLAQVAADPRVEAGALQLVGLKGHDGWALARVR